MAKLSAKDWRELRSMDSERLAVVVPLFRKMARHPFQVNDKPGRLAAVAAAAAVVLAERAA